MYVAPALVAAGDGIAILPRMIIQSSTRDVILKSLTPKDLSSEIGIATRARDRSPMIRTAVLISKAVCKQLSI
jgi:DNA-binding transcriptional LysR family regulator